MTKCLENFVSQTLGFITRFCAAELRVFLKSYALKNVCFRLFIRFLYVLL